MLRSQSFILLIMILAVSLNNGMAVEPPATLVIDRTPGLDSKARGSVPSNFCQIGNTVYFSANDGLNNYELWRSDGTVAGTKKVCEINPRGNVQGESNGSDPQNLINFQGTLYFTAYTETEGRELWKSDGTEKGTVLVKDVQPGPASGILSSGPDFTIYKNQLYFVGAPSETSGLLFRTDGTYEGTVPLGVGPDPLDPQIRSITEIEASGGYLFLNPRGYFSWYGLWRTDGTEEGFIKTSPEDYDWYDVAELTDVNGVLYCNSNNADDLCKSGSTTGSAEVIKSSVNDASGFTAINGKVVFSAQSTSNDLPTVWVTDGTEAGTKKLVNSVEILFPGSFTVIGNQLLFTGQSEDTIWITDGTEAGTHSLPFVDMEVGDGGSSVRARQFTLFNGEIYFLGTYSYRADSYTSLYKSNLTPAGTKRVRSDLHANDFIVFSNQILLSGTTTSFGATHELWRSNGTQNGTALLKDIAKPPATTMNSASAGMAWKNKFYYTDTSQVNYSNRITQTDGTSAGTTYYSEDNFTQIAGTLNSRMILRNFADLYWSDGSPGNESKLNGITLFTDPADGHVKNFVRFGDKALLRGSQIFCIDGSTQETKVVLESPGSSYNWYFTPLNNNLVLMRKQANDLFNSNARELYATDGTKAGTHQILQTADSDGHIDTVIISDGMAYFLMSDDLGVNNDGASKFWQSDGTVAGTVEVAGSPDFYSVKSVGANSSHVIFTSTSNDDNENWLWSYETATSTFTKLEKVSLTGEAITHQEVVFFAGSDGIHGTELWRSDGTAAGTRMTGDLNPGRISSAPRDLTSVGNILLFSAARSNVGCEPFAIDDVNSTPWLVQDINPGPNSSTPRRFTAAPALNAAFFFADNGTSGQELWKIDMTGLQPYTAAKDWCLYQ